MPLPKNPERLTAGQLAEIIADAPAAETRALLKAITKLGLKAPIPVVLGGSALGLAVRAEWVALLRSGRAFARSFLLAIGVGQQGQTQLFNPVGSGMRVLLYSWAADSSIAGAPLIVGTNNVQMAGGAAAPNLLINGAISVARTAAAAAASLPGLSDPIWQQLLALGELAGPGVSAQGFWAEIPAGWGIDWDLLQASSTFRVNLLWAEVPLDYPGASSALSA